MEKQQILDALNKMEVIEQQGGEDAYAIVEVNEENHKLLKEVGIPLETALKYGDSKDKTFCILSLAFGEEYADLYDGERLISFESKIEFELENGKSIIFYKHRGDFYVAICEEGGSLTATKLTEDKLSKIQGLLQ